MYLQDVFETFHYLLKCTCFNFIKKIYAYSSKIKGDLSTPYVMILPYLD